MVTVTPSRNNKIGKIAPKLMETAIIRATRMVTAIGNNSEITAKITETMTAEAAPAEVTITAIMSAAVPVLAVTGITTAAEVITTTAEVGAKVLVVFAITRITTVITTSTGIRAIRDRHLQIIMNPTITEIISIAEIVVDDENSICTPKQTCADLWPDFSFVPNLHFGKKEKRFLRNIAI